MPRMKILNSVEREVFDFPPIFNSVERKRCFDFPTPLQDIATSLRTASNQLVFLLSCGYFKATKLILSAINQHNRRLTSTVEVLLTPDTRALLDTLLRQESADEAAAGSNAAYKLTLMKKLSQSTKPA